MDKKRIQELNALLMKGPFDPKDFQNLPLDETYALFRLAALHHTNLKKQLAGVSGKKPPQAAAVRGSYRQAQEKTLKMLIQRSNYFYALSIERIKALDAFCAVYAQTTNMPYAFCEPNTFNDLTWLFTSEEKANKIIEQKKAQGILLKCLKIENAGFLKFFSGLFYMGIDHLLFDFGTDSMTFGLDHICKKPDFEKIEHPALALNNPALVLSALYYLQEIRKPEKHREKKNLPQLEEEMSRNLVRSSYLVPFIKSDSDGALPQYQAPYLKNKNGDLLLPVFTDFAEFDKYNRDHKYNAAVITFDKLETFGGPHKGILVNPAGFCLYLEKSMLPRLTRRFGA